MATLLQKSQEILSEKEAKILPGNIKSGIIAFGVTGTYSGTDTSDATAIASELYTGKTAYVDGTKITGTNSWTDTLAGGTLTELETLVDSILGSNQSSTSSEAVDSSED